MLCSIAHSIICTRLFRGKMHSDWFNGIEILQGRWQHGEKVGYCYPSELEKTLCKWDIYVALVTKGLKCRLVWEWILLDTLIWRKLHALDCVRLRRYVFLHTSNETFLTPLCQGKSPRVIYFRVNSELPIHLKVTVNVCLGLKVNLPHEALCTV